MRQIESILLRNNLGFTAVGTELRLRFSSALLIVGVRALGRQALVTVRSPVLRDIPDLTDRHAILGRLNDLNVASHFGKWAYYEEQGLIGLEYDLLGDDLQDEELLTALTTLARSADHVDDRLKDEFGGLRAFETPQGLDEESSVQD